MLNSISIYNSHFTRFPRVIAIEYEDREVYIEAVFRKDSVFRISPCLYCLSVDGAILFQDREFNIKGSEIDLDDFIKAVNDYIPCYVSNELKKAVSKLDLIRLYVKINDIPRAKSLVPSVTSNGDLKMIDFMIKYRFTNHESLNLSDLVTETANLESSKCNDKKCNQVRDESTDEKYQRFVDVCNNVDENTKFIFVNEVIELFPNNYFLAIDSLLNYEKAEFSIFTRVKMAHCLIRRKKRRMAVFFLLLAAKSIKKGADLLFKKNLIRMALKLVAESSWCSVFNDIVKEFEIDEIFYFGLPVCNEASLDSFMFLQGPNDNFRFKIEPDELIYEFDVIKQAVRDKFIDKIKIKQEICSSKAKNRDSNDQNNDEVKIIGVLDSESTFYQSFYVNGDAIVSADSDVEISKIVLSDGTETQFSKHMKKIKHEHDIELIDIVKNDSVLLEFAYKDCLECRVFIFAEHEITKNNTGFILKLDKSMDNVEIAVEIAENTFVNRSYQF